MLPLAGSIVKKHKVVVTGSGRAGTTFVMAVLTRLGMNTGFNEQDIQKIDCTTKAGLEVGTILHDNYIMKNPNFMFLPFIYNIFKYCEIDMIYIPIRDLEEVSLSRAKIGDANGGWMNCGSKTVGEQESVLAVALGRLIVFLVRTGTPFVLVDFKRMVTNAQYMYDMFSFVMNKYAITFEQFKTCYDEQSLKFQH